MRRDPSRTRLIGLRRLAPVLLLLVAVFAGPGPTPPAAAAPCEDCQPDDPGGGGGGLPTTTVTGTFRYADTGGLRPIAFADVEVWRYANHGFGVWSWAKDRTVTTDENGRINTTFEYGEQGIVYAVRVTATNYAAVVWPNDAAHTVPFHQEPGEPDGANIHRTATLPNQTLSFSYDFTDGWTPQHFNLAETVRRGYDFAVTRRDPAETDPLPPADIQPTSVLGSFYNPTAHTVRVNSGSVMADLIVLHEYGHYLEDRIGAFPWLPTSHDGCIATGLFLNSAEHAWMEGFSDWFAQAVVRNAPGAGLAGVTGVGNSEVATTVSTLEMPVCTGLPAWVGGNMVENFVAGALWDLTDGASSAEPGDNLADRETEIFQIMDRELDVPAGAGPWPSIDTFRTAWVNRSLGGAALDAVLFLNGIATPAPPPPPVTPTGPSAGVCLRKPWTPGC